MTQIVELQPHDPLPDGPAAILLRRFEEDDPRQDMMELILIDADQGERTLRLLTPDGTPMAWADAERRVRDDAAEAGIERLYRLDRTAGPREHAVEEHRGDRTFDMDKLDDFDLEEGERGSDMRDMDLNEAPRRF
ncbi:MAG: hypothetical protein INR65_01845 [Gluconacetobacter diazotrophicus]|nr:hypothetical protein [Gluconacetobacter diazotrophicus]